MHNPRGGGELDRLTRVAKEEQTFYDKVKGDRKYMSALMHQPERLSQIDRFGMSMLRDPPRSHYFKTLKGPEVVKHPHALRGMHDGREASTFECPACIKQ